jgi:glycerophosphoryl diester phosphodiesterase
MVYLDINKSNYKNNGKDLVKDLDHHLGVKDNKVFLLIFMEGCGPCNATRPEWKKMKNVLNKDFLNRNDIIISSIDHELSEGLKNLTTKPSSFPTMIFITNSGKDVENYEDSTINNKDRTIDSFVEWINLKTGEKNISNSDKGNYVPKKTHKKRHSMLVGGTRKKRGGKWSLKYKRSINCKRPKGFSQKQHCKYGRKK